MSSRNEIERQLQAAEPRFARSFLEMVALIKADVVLEEIASLLEAGQVERAMDAALKTAPRIATPYIDEFISAAKKASASINRAIGQVVIDFDQTNDYAINMMRENRLRLIRGFGQQQRDAVRQVVLRGIEEGTNPLEMARQMRDSIGLTSRQVRAVQNFRQALLDNDSSSLRRALRDKRFDASIRRALRGNPLSAEQINRMVGRYQDRYVAHRAKVIARTESLRAVHQGTEAAFEQAFQEGHLQRDEVTREWNTARDESVRGTHRAMHGQVRSEGEAFESGSGNLLMYPGDPNAPPEETIQCRCAVGRRISLATSTPEFQVQVIG